MSWPEIQHSTINIVNMVKSLFLIQKPKRTETFKEAQERLRLTTERLKQLQRHYTIRSRGLFLVGLVVLSYSYFLVFHKNVIGGGLCTMLVSCPAFALSFRDSFWAYQIRRQRLGCCVEEWFKDNFGIAKLWFRD